MLGCHRSLVLCSLLLSTLSGRVWAGTDHTKSNEARKQVTAAQTELKKAQDALAAARGVVEAEFQKTPEWQTAHDALVKAQADYDASAKAALDKMHATSDYKSAQTMRADGEARLKELQKDPKASTADRTSATTAAMNGRNKMKEMDDSALSTDPKVIANKAAIAEAQGKLDGFKSKLEEMVAADPACQDAQKSVDDAKKKYDDSQAALAAAIKAEQQG
ncbi:MAG: hypothetical protein ACREJC_14440, partial [Tepidisphaeraceae bacterium]